MKLRHLILGLFLSFTGNMLAQVDKQLMLADQLVRYGHETQTALPLIQAYKIYSDLNVIDSLGTEGSQGDSQYSSGKLLEDATRFAGDDGILLALIDEVKAKVRAGALPGPIRYYEYIGPEGTMSHNLRFTRGTYSYVVVDGDGHVDYVTDNEGYRTRQEANLELEIFNSRGESLAADTSLGANCLVSLVPHSSGLLTVEVRNTGSRGCNYVMYVYNE